MTIYLCFRRHAMSNTGTYITRDGEFSFLMGPLGSDSSPRPFLAAVSLPFTSFYLDDSVVVAASEDQAKSGLRSSWTPWSTLSRSSREPSKTSLSPRRRTSCHVHER